MSAGPTNVPDAKLIGTFATGSSLKTRPFLRWIRFELGVHPLLVVSL